MDTTKHVAPSLEDQASVIREKYETLLTLFSKCHSKYNSSEAVEDAEINVLGTTSKLSNYLSVVYVILSFTFSFSNALVNFFTLSTERDIEAFVSFFRSSFPDATFPPKMHMLEEHVVPFLRKWHFPLGFFGEQGGESIHKDFVQLTSTFSHVKPSTTRLKKMLEEHHLVVHPKNRQLIPEKKKRNLKRNEQIRE